MFIEDRGRKFKLVEVGGMRRERRKWIHTFEHVKTVIFVSSLSSIWNFDDAHEVNEMDETIELFKEVGNSTWFESCNIITLFNKYDIWRTNCSLFGPGALHPLIRSLGNYKKEDFFDEQSKSEGALYFSGGTRPNN